MNLLKKVFLGSLKIFVFKNMPQQTICLCVLDSFLRTIEEEKKKEDCVKAVVMCEQLFICSTSKEKYLSALLQ